MNALMPFQAQGQRWLAKAQRGMLAWDPGTGKTPTAIRACDEIAAIRILVFCPPIATSVWSSHFKAWSAFRHDIRVMEPGMANRPFEFCKGTGVKIIPFSLLGRDTHEAVAKATSNSGAWDVVIIDECHYLKNPEAKRTRAVYGKHSPCPAAKHVWCLSGTPLLNHPAEFWTHLNALAPETLMVGAQEMGYEHFVTRFCVGTNTAYGYHIVGAKNTHELSERVKPFMHRRRMKDVLPQMPKLRIVETPLPEDTPIPPELRAELEKVLIDLEIDDFDQLSDEALLATIRSGSVAFSTARRLIGQAKVNAVAVMIEDELAGSDEKLIVFAHHREVIESLALSLVKHKPLVIHGGTPQFLRDQGIRLFQNDPKFRLIILAIDAAGEAVTLTAAHRLFIVEPSPVPAKNAQAIGRAHRLGQTLPVLAHFILLPGIDRRLMSIAARKTRDIAAIIDPDLKATPKPQPVLFPEDRI